MKQLKYNAPKPFVIIWIIIILILIGIKAFGQDRKDLPIINQRILYYVDSMENTVVEKGLCRHFVNEAVQYATGVTFRTSWFGKLDVSEIYTKDGFNLPRKYALPGDILSMSGHVGIIYEISDTSIIIAHQNSPKGFPVTIERFCKKGRFQIKYIRVLKAF